MGDKERNAQSFWAGAASRRFLPWSAAVGGLVISLLVWGAVRENQHAHLRQSIELEGASIRNELVSRLEFRIRELKDIAADLATPKYANDESIFREQAKLIAAPTSGFRVIQTLDAEGRVRWVYSPRDTGDQLGFDLLSDRELRQAFDFAREGNVAASTFVRPARGPMIFSIIVPLDPRGATTGYLVGILDPAELFRQVLPPSFAPGFAFGILDEEDEVFRRASQEDSDLERKYALDLPFRFYGADWHVKVWPMHTRLTLVMSLLPEALLILGVLLSGVLAYTLHLLQLSQYAEIRWRALNDELEQRVAERTRSVEQYAAEIARSNAELEQFAFIASHDLKEPLRMVTSYVQLLKRRYQGKLDAEADEFIGFAASGAQRMAGLIDALLKYSRIGRGETTAIPVDLDHVVELALRNLQPFIMERRALIHCGELPTVDGDSTLLVQLFQNLIANAIKFYDGNEAPQVWIAAEPAEGFWKLSVRDNGIGIDPREAQRVFIIFQRLNRNPRYPGTGIGLAVCKKIVERHRGRIWVESEKGQGATFYFTLPAPRETLLARPVSPAHAPLDDKPAPSLQ